MTSWKESEPPSTVEESPWKDCLQSSIRSAPLPVHGHCSVPIAVEGFDGDCSLNRITTDLSGDGMSVPSGLSTQMEADAWLCRLRSLLATSECHSRHATCCSNSGPLNHKWLHTLIAGNSPVSQSVNIHFLWSQDSSGESTDNS